MTDQAQSDEIRRIVVEALTHANAIGIEDHPDREAFLAGRADISLQDLEIDSLAAMEFCIYLELNCGIEITPDELEDVRSIKALASIVSGNAPDSSS